MIHKILFVANTLAWSVAFIMLIVLTGCSDDFNDYPSLSDGGGGRDAVTIHMPFANGYQSQCVQGVGDDYSHDYPSTYFDLDFDTPNDEDDSIFAPIAGTAYVHESEDGFGTHINVDLGDGTYIVLGHLSQTLVSNGEPVAQGQLIGVEGTTGNSNGDHVHIGRHEGDAQEDAVYGTSIDGLSMLVYSNATGSDETFSVHDLTCDLYDGHIYTSRLSTPLWHPDGSLVKSPNDADVFLLKDGSRHLIDDEEVFWSYNFSFDDLAMVDESAMDCFNEGSTITQETSISALTSDGDVWLLVGSETDEDRYAIKVRSTAWQDTLASWGITAQSSDDLSEDNEMLERYPHQSGYATFRDGTVLTEESTSDVYFVSDGTAMPIIDYDTFLMLDLYGRDMLTLEDGTVEVVQGRVGDCATGDSCLTTDLVITCGGPEATFTAAGNDDGDTGEADVIGDQSDDGSDDQTDDEDDQSDSGLDADEDGEQESQTDIGTDEGSDESEEVQEACELTITWDMPDGDTASRITLDVEIEQDGDGYGSWDSSTSVSTATSISEIFALADDDTKARANITYQETSGGVESWGCVSTSSSEDDDELVGEWYAQVLCGDEADTLDVTVYHKTEGVVDGCEAEMTW